MTARVGSGLFRALLDAIHGSDNQIGGSALTRLRLPLLAGDATIAVDATFTFGEMIDGTGDGRVVIGGEIIGFTGRTANTFTGLTRGLESSAITDLYPPNTVVFDWSANSSGLDHVKRGISVNYAVGADLDVIARNLGLRKCFPYSDAQWRAYIKAVAYLPKQTLDAFRIALEAIYGIGNFSVSERLVSMPHFVLVEVEGDAPINSLAGKFVLNSGELHVTTGAGLTVTTDHAIVTSPVDPAGTLGVFGVWLDTPLARMGVRDGATNYFTGGSYLGSVITLGANPGIGVAVIVDYNGHPAHYLSPDDAFRNDGTDFPPYFSDNGGAANCALDQIRAAGVGLKVSIRP